MANIVIFPLLASPLKGFHTSMSSSPISPVFYIQLVINFSNLKLSPYLLFIIFIQFTPLYIINLYGDIYIKTTIKSMKCTLHTWLKFKFLMNIHEDLQQTVLSYLTSSIVNGTTVLKNYLTVSKKLKL